LDFFHFLSAFLSLLMISNPLSVLPAVLKLTRNQNLEEKKKTGLVAAVAVLVILLSITWIGKPLLLVLGIKLPAFQVAGGVVIFLMAMSMLNAEESPIKQTSAEETHNLKKESGAIVPLAIPIIAGPGTISTLIVQINQYPGVLNAVIISLVVILVSFLIGLLLYFAATLERLLGQSRINIINRLGGLFLAAIAVQTLAEGIRGLFPSLR